MLTKTNINKQNNEHQTLVNDPPVPVMMTGFVGLDEKGPKGLGFYQLQKQKLGCERSLGRHQRRSGKASSISKRKSRVLLSLCLVWEEKY